MTTKAKPESMMQPPKGTTRRGLFRREVLLKEATEEFLAHGYEGASLSSILKRAGGSRTTIYTQFGDKAGLFEAAALHSIEKLAHITEIPETDDREPQIVLFEFACLYLEKVTEAVSLQHHRIVTGEVVRFPDVGRQLMESYVSGLTGNITKYLHRLTTSHVLAVSSAAETAAIFMGMIKGDVHLRALLDVTYRPSRAEITRHATRCVDILLNGLDKP